MKNINKFLLSLSLLITLNLLHLSSFAFDKFLTVKFKTPPTEKFIKDLNKMTDTSLVKSEPPATYVLKITRIANNDTFDRYSELFTIMQNVAEVSPVPKEKPDDNINLQFYLHNSIQNNSVSKDTNQETPNDSSKSQANDKYSASVNQAGVITSFPLTKRDVKVTFKIGEEKDAMNWFNEVFGTKLVGKKGYSTYILRFPDNINVKMVVRALKVCSSVASVEVSTD